MHGQRLAALAALLAPLAAGSGAKAGSSSKSVTFELRAIVPVVCRLSHDGLLAPDGSMAVEEFCNEPRGYRVFALHPGGLAAAGMVFEYGAASVPAEADGETLLLDAPTAAKTVRSFRVRGPGGVLPVALPAVSLRIVPK